MVKADMGLMLVIGMKPSELEHLKQGKPIFVRLDDVGRTGQAVMLLVGDTDEKMKAEIGEAMQRITDASKGKSGLILPN